MKPSPRSHRRSLARSDRIGERRWRRGVASIPLVNLSERFSSGIDCDPRFVVATSGEHCPGDAGELVGERDRQQVAVGGASRLVRSTAIDPASPCRPPHQHDVGSLNEQRPKVFVAAFGDLAELGARGASFEADRKLIRGRRCGLRGRVGLCGAVRQLPSHDPQKRRSEQFDRVSKLGSVKQAMKSVTR